MSNSDYNPKNPINVGLAVAGGTGLCLIMIALGVGVIQGEAASSTVIGLLFAAGVALLVFGIGGWIGSAQPYKHFDDINQPMYTGHHHDDEH